jgi:serine protease AprX
MVAASLAVVLSFASLLAARASGGLELGAPAATGATTESSSPLAELATDHPARTVEVIVQLRPGTDPATGRALVEAAGGTISRQLPIINGFGTRMPAQEAQQLTTNPAIHAISLNAAVSRESIDPAALATSYNQSVRTTKAWADGYNGRGVGVAVIDTGIAGNLPDFRTSASNPASRVIASAVVNPAAQNAGDSFGHGTHIAGLIAGNGDSRPAGDPLSGRYVGAAPKANLISVKASDEEGNATVLDVIDGLQFVMDHKATYNIRVVNLSLASTQAESYKTDPLDAAVEAAWNSGIVVVAAAGNSGSDADAVSYAPANDPFIITVGSVDDQGTKTIGDDHLSLWSSRGKTQDGFEKPEILAPGAHMASTVPSNALYRQLCPECVVDGDYFKVGGTSMAAAVVSGFWKMRSHSEKSRFEVMTTLRRS